MTNESHLGHLRRKLRADEGEAEHLSRIFQAKQYVLHSPFRADVDGRRDGDAGAIETKSLFRPAGISIPSMQHWQT